MELATALRELGQVAEGEAVYRALLQLADEPGPWEPIAWLGVCANLRRDLPAAAEHVAAALAAAPPPQPWWVRMECAVSLRELGRVTEAEAIYRALLTEEPGAWEPSAGLGECARLRHDLPAAAEHFAAALVAAPAPQPRWLRMQYAATLRELGRVAEAEAVYRALLDEQPDAWEPAAWLGKCARLRHDLPTAAEHFTAALVAAPAPQAWWVRMEYATTLRELERVAEAEAVYRALLAEQPGAWEPTAWLGMCARLHHDLPAAAEHFAAALVAAPAPQPWWVRVEYATTLREMERIAEAEAVYRALLAEQPGVWELTARLGQCARLRHDLPAAAGHFAAALAAAPAPQPQWVRIEYATTLRELGRVAEAEAVYRALLAEQPAAWEPTAWLGVCARLRHDLPAAAEHFTAALVAAPALQPRWVRMEYATTLRELGRLAEAEAVYRALLAEQPGAWEPLAWLGICARLRLNLPAAAEHFTAALAAAPAPQPWWVRMEYATTLRELGRLAEAEAVYRALLAEQPGGWEPLAGLAVCARLRNDRLGAIAHLAAAVEIAPEAEGARLELAARYRELGCFDEARAMLRAWLDRSPSSVRAWLGLGYVERSAENHPGALQIFKEGHARYPERHRIALEIGIEERALGRFADAEPWLLRAAEIETQAGWALSHLGETLRQANQLDGALEVLGRAAAVPGAPARAHALMAQTLADLSRMDEAFAVLDEAERRIGSWPDLTCQRAYLLRRTGFRFEALAVMRGAIAAAPTYFPLWFEWFENERFSGDAASLDRCLTAAPANTVGERVQVHCARGMVAEQRWQLDAAAAEFAAAIALDASVIWAHEALARIGLLRFDIATARKHLLVIKRLQASGQRRQGLSPHLTHTFIGQIFEEFLVDRAATEAVAEALAAEPQRRVGRLLALIRAAPNHTPAAIALLLTLREAAKLAPPGQDARSPSIPATIVQYWNEAVPPRDIAALMESWRECNPGWRYLRFDDFSARAFLKAHCRPEVLQAYLRAREPAMKADLFRLAYLFAEGGCYADADDRCLRPLGELVPAQARFIAWQEEFGTLGNNFIAAVPLHPLLGLALNLAVEAVNRGDDDIVWLCTGPGLMTRAFAQSLASSSLLPEGWLESMAILDRAELERVVAIHCLTSYRNSRRNWHRATFGQPRPAEISAQIAA